jgi:hypothetical protein
MRTCALIVALLLAGCRSPVTGEETEGSSSSSDGRVFIVDR